MTEVAAERGGVELAQDPQSKIAASGDTEPVTTGAAAVEKAIADDEGPARLAGGR